MVTVSYNLIVNKRVRSPSHIDRIPQDIAVITSDPNSVNVNGNRMTAVSKDTSSSSPHCRVSVNKIAGTYLSNTLLLSKGKW